MVDLRSLKLLPKIITNSFRDYQHVRLVANKDRIELKIELIRYILIHLIYAYI